MPLVASPAPAFTLPALVSGAVRDVSLSDHKGKWVVFAWYPKDQTAVCQSELVEFDALHGELESRDAVLLAASCQGIDTKKAWVEGELGSTDVPLLADVGGKVASDYGVFVAGAGISLRSTFIIDPEGVVKWHTDNFFNIGRSTDEILRMLDALQSGGICLVNWHKG
jgi:peroxiredoxin (alkyl hydroperoxide reductase subunit C)